MRALNQLFRKLARRPQAIATFQNIAWLAAEKCCRILFSLWVGFWVARHLGSESFGTLSYALAIATGFAVLAEFGLDGVLRRELLADPERRAQMLGAAFVVRLLAAGCCVLLIWGGLYLLEPDLEKRTLALIGSLLVLQPAFCSADAWFHVHLKSKLVVLCQMAGVIVGGVLRIVAILSDAPVHVFVWIAVAEGGVVSAVSLGMAAYAKLRFSFSLQWSLIGRLLQSSWPLLASGLTVVLYMRLDLIMLRAFSGSHEVGIYSAGARLVEMVFFVPVILGASVFPALSRLRKMDPHRYVRLVGVYSDLNSALAYAFAISVTILAGPIVEVCYGSRYSETIDVLRVQVWSTLFVFAGVARSQVFLNEGLERPQFLSTLMGLIANFLLNWALIPPLGSMGAAIATIVGYAVAAWISTWCFSTTRAVARVQTKSLFVPFRILPFAAELRHFLTDVKR